MLHISIIACIGWMSNPLIMLITACFIVFGCRPYPHTNEVTHLKWIKVIEVSGLLHYSLHGMMKINSVYECIQCEPNFSSEVIWSVTIPCKHTVLPLKSKVIITANIFIAVAEYSQHYCPQRQWLVMFCNSSQIYLSRDAFMDVRDEKVDHKKSGPQTFFVNNF